MSGKKATRRKRKPANIANGFNMSILKIERNVPPSCIGCRLESFIEYMNILLKRDGKSAFPASYLRFLKGEVTMNGMHNISTKKNILKLRRKISTSSTSHSFTITFELLAVLIHQVHLRSVKLLKSAMMLQWHQLGLHI